MSNTADALQALILSNYADTLHKDINTTRIYLRLSDEDVKREVQKLQF